MNQTLIIATTQAQEIVTHTVTHSTLASQLGIDFMMVLRILWYIFCIIKIVSIAFFSKPKPSIRERVLRKFLISHNELLRSFNEEDKHSMEQILNNTIKNASSRLQCQTSRLRKTSKKVSFEVAKNNYYDPKEWREQEPIFYDIVTGNQHTIHLHENSSFQEKKHEEEFIEREDLLGLNEKSQSAEEEKEKEEESTRIHIKEADVCEEIKEEHLI